jgi:hypothetical protein
MKDRIEAERQRAKGALASSLKAKTDKIKSVNHKIRPVDDDLNPVDCSETQDKKCFRGTVDSLCRKDKENPCDEASLQSPTATVAVKLARGAAPAGTISFDDAAERAGVAKSTIIHWFQNGWLAGERVGRFNNGVYPDALEAFLAERERQRQLHPKAKLGRVQEVPEGALNSPQLAKHLGVCVETIYRWTHAGLLVPVAIVGSGHGTHYFMVPTAEVIAALKRGLPRGRKPSPKNESSPTPEAPTPSTTPKATVTPKPKVAVAPKAVSAPKVTPKPKAKTVQIVPQKPAPAPTPAPVPTHVDFVAYDVAVEAGRSNPCFQNVLGFNVLSHPKLGFRAAKVSEKPEWPWRYHERHGLNGWGQWQVRAQRPVTGEILL